MVKKVISKAREELLRKERIWIWVSIILLAIFVYLYVPRFTFNYGG